MLYGALVVTLWTCYGALQVVVLLLLLLLLLSRTVSEIRRLIGRKSPIRTHPTLIQRPRSEWSPSSFGMNLISPETRMMGLPYGEELMIVGRTMWTQSTSVTDRRTDGQTDRQTDGITITDTVQRRASHGKNGATAYPVDSNLQCLRFVTKHTLIWHKTYMSLWPN